MLGKLFPKFPKFPCLTCFPKLPYIPYSWVYARARARGLTVQHEENPMGRRIRVGTEAEWRELGKLSQVSQG